MPYKLKRKDGGPAFPVSFGPDGTPGYDDGQSLRDYFAGQALPALIANMQTITGLWDHTAREAYAAADAMLVARERSDG